MEKEERVNEMEGAEQLSQECLAQEPGKPIQKGEKEIAAVFEEQENEVGQLQKSMPEERENG